MKRTVSFLVAFVMLMLTSCTAMDSSQENLGDAQSDPIYNESAPFNSLHGSASGALADAEISNSADESGGTEQSVGETFAQYTAAMNEAKKLRSFKLSAHNTVSVEVDTTSVELEKGIYELSLDANGDFISSRRVDLKDMHNTSLSRTVADIYGDKSAGRNYVRTEYSNFDGTEPDYLENKKQSYKLNVFENVLGAAYELKGSQVDSAGSTEADGVTTLKFMITSKAANSMAYEELTDAGIDIRANDISVSYFIVTAYIDMSGVLFSGEVSVRLNVSGRDADTVYTISRGFDITDENSDAILCERPEWM